MLSRRSLLEAAALGVAGLGTAGLTGSSQAVANNSSAIPAPQETAAQSAAGGREKLPPIHRFGRMLHDYHDGLIRRRMQARSEQLSTIDTREKALAYIGEVRKKIHAAFGPFPERTPLNAKITGSLSRDTYRIDKLLFESQPGFFVTANLYVPTVGPGPFPAVVGECGHAVNGKAYKSYQSFSQGLTRQGYVVLIFDPVSQGERIQYGAEDPAKSQIGIGVLEHLHEGNQQFLVGDFLGTTRAWDAIRALDYLQSRDDVDPKKIGITGSSGGGTMTMWLAALDDRWAMAAPSCAVTSFYRNFQNELPTDTEQCPPGVLAIGLDHADFLAVMAPKPVVILAQEEDFFDVRGSEQAFKELQPLWKLLGNEENLQLSIAPGGHDYSQVSREAMYAMFHRGTGKTMGSKEPVLHLENDADLFVTAKGQVSELGGVTLFDLTQAKAVEKAKQRPVVPPQQIPAVLREELQLTGVPAVPEYRILRGISGRKYPRNGVTHYALGTESGIETIVYRLAENRLESRPPRSEAACLLYVSDLSADAELREEEWLRKLISDRPSHAVFACDLRGVGDSLPDTCGGVQTHLQPYGNDYFYAIHGLMLGRSMPVQRTHDLLSTIEWLKSLGHARIELAAMNRGTIPALFAACMLPEVTKITLRGMPPSYQSIAEAEHYEMPLSLMIRDVLSRFDLPDCVASLQHRKVEMEMV